MIIHQSERNFTIRLCKMLIANKRWIANYHIKLSLTFNFFLVICEEILAYHCCTILCGFFSLNIIQLNPKHVVPNLFICSAQLSITSSYGTQKTTIAAAWF